MMRELFDLLASILPTIAQLKNDTSEQIRELERLTRQLPVEGNCSQLAHLQSRFLNLKLAALRPEDIYSLLVRPQTEFAVFFNRMMRQFRKHAKKLYLHRKAETALAPCTDIISALTDVCSSVLRAHTIDRQKQSSTEVDQFLKTFLACFSVYICLLDQVTIVSEPIFDRILQLARNLLLNATAVIRSPSSALSLIQIMQIKTSELLYRVYFLAGYQTRPQAKLSQFLEA